MRLSQAFVIGMGCFGLLVASSGTARAQSAVTSFDELAGRIKPATAVSITDDAGHTVKGKLVDLSPSSVTVLAKGGRQTLEKARVQQVARVRRNTGKGALQGLAIGALGGAVGMLIACGDCGEYAMPFAMSSAILFGGIGAGVGAAVGAAHTSEQVLYRAPAPRSDSAFAVQPLVSRRGSGIAATFRF